LIPARSNTTPEALFALLLHWNRQEIFIPMLGGDLPAAGFVLLVVSPVWKELVGQLGRVA
jgi:hypothetical protein